MAMKFSRSKAALAASACLSMVATPALADRGWGGGGGWGGGWGGGGHHDRGISAGDVFAGILIIGGIAAIASAASKSDRDRRAREQDRDYRYPDSTYRGDQSQRYGNERDSGYRPSARSIDGAVDTCVNEVERSNNRVDTVDSAARDGEGWRIAGRTGNGRQFACSVGSDGRVRSVSVDGRAAYSGDAQRYVSEPVIQRTDG